jgi:hypothetical protein
MKKILSILFLLLVPCIAWGNVRGLRPIDGEYSWSVTGSLTITTVNATNVVGTITTASYSLDSDKLDAQEGTYYTNASNIDAGTLGLSYLDSAVVTSNYSSAVTINDLLTVTSMNATGVIQYAGTDINTAGTLTNVAYENQANVFTEDQNISTINAASATGLVLFDDGDNYGIVIEDGGQVGIGTSAASEALEVSGNILITSSESGVLNLLDSNDDLYISLNSGGNSYVNTGNFGIGTNVPTEELEVNGDIEISTANYFVLGPADTDNSWRFRVSGNNLVFERRESAAWVNKGEFTP